MNEMNKRVVPYLSAKPEINQNTIIVAHDDPFEAATGIYPKPQGVCYIIQPQGKERFRILRRLTHKEW